MLDPWALWSKQHFSTTVCTSANAVLHHSFLLQKPVFVLTAGPTVCPGLKVQEQGMILLPQAGLCLRTAKNPQALFLKKTLPEEYRELLQPLKVLSPSEIKTWFISSNFWSPINVEPNLGSENYVVFMQTAVVMKITWEFHLSAWFGDLRFF